MRKKFVQLGKTINGKIVKNERYDVEEFCQLVFPVGDLTTHGWIKYSWFDKLFNTKKYRDAIKEAEEWEFIEVAHFRLGEKIRELIDKDKKGKGSWKNQKI